MRVKLTVQTAVEECDRGGGRDLTDEGPGPRGGRAGEIDRREVDGRLVVPRDDACG